MWNYSKLKGRMAEYGYRQEDICGRVGISPTTFSLKLNNKAEFKQSEINQICDILGIPSKEINAYFFTPKV